MPECIKELSISLWLRLWSWSLGSSPILGSWWGICFSLCLYFCLSLSLTIVNNIIKNQHPPVRCLQDVHLRPIDTSRLIGEGKSSTTLMDIKRKLEDPYLYQTNEIWNQTLGDTWWLRLSICSQLRVWSWDPRIESHIGLPLGSLPLPLPMFLPLLLCVSLMNK